jgi:hypothetical protein
MFDDAYRVKHVSHDCLSHLKDGLSGMCDWTGRAPKVHKADFIRGRWTAPAEAWYVSQDVGLCPLLNGAVTVIACASKSVLTFLSVQKLGVKSRSSRRVTRRVIISSPTTKTSVAA